jgi:hypothetical protein
LARIPGSIGGLDANGISNDPLRDCNWFFAANGSLVPIHGGRTCREASLVPHSSRVGFDAMAKVKKSRIRRSLPAEELKKDDSWFRQMPDPCQVEG